MGLLALLIVQTADPIRIAAVILGVLFVWKTYGEGRRMVPLALVLLVVSLLTSFVISEMQGGPFDAGAFAVRTATGFIASSIIAAVVAGIAKLFSARRSRA